MPTLQKRHGQDGTGTKKWAAFFMELLVKPGSFEWDKKFLMSEAAKALIEPNMEAVTLPLPMECFPDNN